MGEEKLGTGGVVISAEQRLREVEGVLDNAEKMLSPDPLGDSTARALIGTLREILKRDNDD